LQENDRRPSTGGKRSDKFSEENCGEEGKLASSSQTAEKIKKAKGGRGRREKVEIRV